MPTEPFRDVLLEVWREACRHIEIHESASTLAALLERHLPLAALMVRRFDAGHHALDTVAYGAPSGQQPHSSARTMLHLVPAGKPAPPMRRMPESLSVWMIASGPSSPASTRRRTP